MVTEADVPRGLAISERCQPWGRILVHVPNLTVPRLGEPSTVSSTSTTSRAKARLVIRARRPGESEADPQALSGCCRRCGPSSGSPVPPASNRDLCRSRGGGDDVHETPCPTRPGQQAVTVALSVHSCVRNVFRIEADGAEPALAA
jgi:hypothetical protein